MSERRNLLTVARRARRRAFAPCSRFTVGAALLTRAGHMYDGCNVEMTGDSGICAEGLAVAHALTLGALQEGQHFIRAVAITTQAGEYQQLDSPAAGAPCGSCRQVLNDFSDAPHCTVVLDDGGDGLVFPLRELLPYAFCLPLTASPPFLLQDAAALEKTAEADPSPRTLRRVAESIRAHAAAHTRHQPEGAVILTAEGRAFCGVSVENSNTNHYTRALAVALYRAVLAGVHPPFARVLALSGENPHINPALREAFALPGHVVVD